MEDNPNINNQSVSPVQPVAQPNGQMPNEFIPPAQPMQFVSQPENGGVSPKKNKKMLVLVVCLLVVAIIVVAIIVLLSMFKKEEPTLKPEEGTETSSEDVKIIKDGKWSCYTFSTSDGVQADEDGKLHKTGNIESKDNIVFGADGSELEIDLDSKVANDSTYGEKFSVDKRGSDLFYNPQGNTVFDKYKAHRYMDGLDMDGLEGEEALPPELQTRLDYTIWLNAENQSEMLFKFEVGSGSAYYYITVYCLNDPELVSVSEYQPTDTILKDAIAQIIAGITNYQSNNHGELPSGENKWSGFINGYIDDMDDYDLKWCGVYGKGLAVDCAEPDDLVWKSNGNEIYVAFGATCNSEKNGIILSNGRRDYAVYAMLSNNSVYCADTK